MGSNNASTGGGGGGVGPAGMTGTTVVAGKTKRTYGTKKDAKKTSSRNEFRSFVKGGGGTGAITKPIRKKTEDVNRKFYEEKVLPSGKSKYKNYEDYIRARGRGEVDAYGREISKSDNNNNQVVQAPKTTSIETVKVTSPTTAEVSQSKATEAKAVEDSIEERKRKVKAKGRSPTILTGVTGVTGGLTLGKPSLLGR